MIDKYNKKLSEAYNEAYKFFTLILTEIRESRKIYGIEDARVLKQYYSNFHKHQSKFDYARHYSSLRVMNLIKNVHSGNVILDAGSGTGSEAILCGIFGAKAVGIDITERHINLAKKRVKYFENILNKKIDVSFELKNVLDHKGSYDLIWVNEAISHIEPLKKFFNISFKNLKLGGKLIIADSNKLNPIIYYESKKEQKAWGGLFVTRQDPNTGKDYIMAIERYFTIPGIKKLLSKYFTINEVYAFGYFPYLIYNKLKQICINTEVNLIRKLPLIKYFSGGYVITSTKL